MAEIQEDSVANPRRKCCNALRFEGVKEAKGYNAVRREEHSKSNTFYQAHL